MKAYPLNIKHTEIFVTGIITPEHVKRGNYTASLDGIYETEEIALSMLQIKAKSLSGTVFLLAPFVTNMTWMPSEDAKFYTTDEEGYLIPYEITEEEKFEFEPFIK